MNRRTEMTRAKALRKAGKIATTIYNNTDPGWGDGTIQGLMEEVAQSAESLAQPDRYADHSIIEDSTTGNRLLAARDLHARLKDLQPHTYSWRAKGMRKLINRAAKVVGWLEQVVQASWLEQAGIQNGMPLVMSVAARRITSAAALLLPVPYCNLKTEEFAAELFYLAADGASRRSQVAHAFRVLATIVPLRRAIAADRRVVKQG